MTEPVVAGPPPGPGDERPPDANPPAEVTERPHPLTPLIRGWVVLLAIVLTAPLPAAGEEFLFRGYLLQISGMISRSPWLAVASSATIFAALPLPQLHPTALLLSGRRHPTMHGHRKSASVA